MQGLGANGRAGTVQAVFIRAPQITSVGSSARVVATLADGRVVAAAQGNILGIAFHPEISGELRLHRALARAATRFSRRRRH